MRFIWYSFYLYFHCDASLLCFSFVSAGQQHQLMARKRRRLVFNALNCRRRRQLSLWLSRASWNKREKEEMSLCPGLWRSLEGISLTFQCDEPMFPRRSGVQTGGNNSACTAANAAEIWWMMSSGDQRLLRTLPALLVFPLKALLRWRKRWTAPLTLQLPSNKRRRRDGGLKTERNKRHECERKPSYSNLLCFNHRGTLENVYL